MNKLQTPHFLWILAAVIIVFLISAVIIDQVTHSNPAPATKPVSDTQKNVKTGNRVGDLAPDFKLITIDNREINLSDYRGKNVILNFWATWCGPCNFELPFIKAVDEEWSKAGVVIIAVNTQDTFERASSYAKTNELKFIIPVDVKGSLINLYAVRGMPTTFFINRDGIITSIKIGPFIGKDEVEERMKSFE